MVQPASGTTLQYPYIGELMWEYITKDLQLNLIASKVLPFYQVPDEIAYVPVISREQILKLGDSDLLRAPGAGYETDDSEFEQKNYQCYEYGKARPVDDVLKKKYAKLFDAREVAARLTMKDIWMRYEYRTSSLLFNATTFSGFTGGVSTEWNTASTCTPRADVATAITAIRNNTGMEANGAIMTITSLENVLASTDFKGWAQYTLGVQNLPVTVEQKAQMAAAYLGIPKVHVAAGVYDSAKKGQTFVSAYLWSYEYVLVGKFAEEGTPIEEPAIGRSLLWSADSPVPVVAESYYNDEKRCEMMRCRHYIDEKVFFPECGYLLSNIHT